MNAIANPPNAALSEAARGFERESELLPRDLPPFAARGLSIFLTALAIAAFLFALFVRFPETVHATFVLVPEHGANPVTSPRRGIVESVHVEDASEVKAGDLLYVIRSDELRIVSTEKAALEKESASTAERLHEIETEAKARAATDAASRAEVETHIKRLEAEREQSDDKEVVQEERHKIALENLKARIKGSEEETAAERHRIELVKRLQEKAEASYKSGVIPEWDVLKERYGYQLADIELVRANQRAVEAQAALADLEASRRVELRERSLERTRLTGEIAETKAALDKQLKENESREIMALDRARQMRAFIEKSAIQIEAMARELQSADGGLLKVFAPYSGTVIKLGAQRPGEVIERGTTLCELAAAGEKLVAEISILEKEAGLVAKGQKVKLLFSAYPYPRFGTRAGTLNWLSPAAGAKGSFRALAEIEAHGVVLHGQERPFRAGMSGDVRILAGDRTLIEFVLEPLIRLRENVAKQ